MRLVLVLLLGATASWATGPLYGHKDAEDLQEFRNVYNDIQHPKISTGTAQNFSIQFASVTNLIVSSMTASTVSIGSTTTYGLTVSSSGLSINGVAYSAPAAQGSSGTYLRNDGGGGLTWKQFISWQGYHDNFCSWTSATGGTPADPTADATCSLVQVDNNGFGTVTSAQSGGNALPGIVFTPTRTGRYFVCATATAQGNASTNGAIIYLFDSLQSAFIARAEIDFGILRPATLCGVFNIGSLSSETLKIQMAGTGANTCNISVLSSNAHTIEWNIFSLQ